MATSSQSQSSLGAVSQPESSSSAASQSDMDFSANRSPVVRLLDRLKSSTQVDLSRKRRTPSNPSKDLKKGKGSVASEPLTVAAFARVEQFPDEHFSVVSDKLFCTACMEQLSVKKSAISLHIKSAKHAAGVQCLHSKCARERNIADLLKKSDEEVHPVGEGLPEDVRIYRIKVLG